MTKLGFNAGGKVCMVSRLMLIQAKEIAASYRSLMAKVALESPLSKKSAPASSLLRSITFLKKYRGIALGVYLLAILTNGFAVIIPQTIRWIIDAGVIQQNMDILLSSLLGLLLLTVFKGLVDFTLGRWTEVASQGVAYDIRNAIFDKLSSLSFAYHDQAQTGQLLARSISDVERIRFLTGRAFVRLFQHSTLMLLTFIALLLMNAQLALLSMLLIPLLAYIAYRLGSIYRPLSLELQHQLAEMTTVLEQNLARRQNRQSLRAGRCRDRPLRGGKQQVVPAGAAASQGDDAAYSAAGFSGQPQHGRDYLAWRPAGD